MPRKTATPKDLALALVPKPPELEMVKWRIPKPLLERLGQYLECYKDLRGEAVDVDVVIPLILEAHLSKDRAFAAWLKDAPKAVAA